MSFIKCFDVVSSVVDEATKQFSPIFRIDEEKYDILHQYCDILDEITKRADGEAYDVEIDDTKMTISVSIECPEFTIDNKNDIFYKLLPHCVSLKFGITGRNVRLTLVFASIWDKA